MKKEHLPELVRILGKLYPEVRSELNFRNDYELLVSVMLSAQCTDKKVNQVTPHLFARFGDFRKLSQAELEEIEEIIRPINYYRTKARNLRAMAEVVSFSLHGVLPLSRDELIKLPGVGRKTANVVISEHGSEPALPVDTHVLRLSGRLGLSAKTTPEGVEEDLMKLFKPQFWRELHHRLIYHGRRVCKARSPLCKECGLSRICPSYDRKS